jgi:hypothetical protein
MLLPCQPCCKSSPDPCCQTGELPDTVTVTFEGPQGTKVEGPNLLGLAFSACYGSGAEGTATAPGGDIDSDFQPLTKGPISAVALTKAGSGYAKLGRQAPTLTLANSNTQPATVSISLSQQQDACGVHHWVVSALSVTSGGYGYTDGDTLTLTAANGDTVEQAVAGTITTTTAQPTLAASASPGSGATFTVSLQANGTTPETWGVSSIGVSGTTSGYPDGTALSFSGSGVIEQSAGYAVIRTGRVAPTIAVSVYSYSEGAGAQITPTLTKTTDYENRDVWTVSALTIDDGGSGYSAGDYIYATVVDGQENYFASLYANVDSVDEDGAITAVSIYSGGEYFKSNGIIQSVEVTTPGEYYIGGVLQSVSITNGGRYYRSNASLPPYVANVSVGVVQGWPGNGSGAVITATVNSNTASADFGKIQSVQLSNGGTNYFGFRWIYTCDCDFVYGEPPGTNYSVVAYRNAPWDYFNRPGDYCSFTGFRCWSGSTAPSFGLIALQITSPMQRESFEPFVSSPFPYVVAPAGKPGVHNGPSTGFAQDLNSLVRHGLGFPFALPGRVQITPDKLYPGGHDVSCAMVQRMAPDGVRPYWEVTSVTVTGGITGLANGDAVTLLVAEYENGPEEMEFDDLSGYGENDAGPLPARRVARGSAVVDANGILTGVTLTDRGVFYLRKHSTEVPALVSPVTATIFQALPSQGSGAEFTVTVNADTASFGFGGITLNLVSGGDGYLGNTSGGELVTVQYNGPDSPPTVTIFCPTFIDKNGVVYEGGGKAYTADKLVPDCSDMSFDAYFGSSKISVAPGGAVTPIFQGNNKCCGKCHVQCNKKVTQVSITFSLTAKQGKAIRLADQPNTFNFTDLGEQKCLPSLAANGSQHTQDFSVNPWGSLELELQYVGWPLLEDSFEINCPGDTYEVIFDIEDIMYSLENSDCWDNTTSRSVAATSDRLQRQSWWPSEQAWPAGQNAASWTIRPSGLVPEAAGYDPFGKGETHGIAAVDLFGVSPSAVTPRVRIADKLGGRTYTAAKQKSTDQYFSCSGFSGAWNEATGYAVPPGQFAHSFGPPPPAHGSKYTREIGVVPMIGGPPRGYGASYGYRFVGTRICDQYAITVDIQAE